MNLYSNFSNANILWLLIIANTVLPVLQELHLVVLVSVGDNVKILQSLEHKCAADILKVI